MWHVPHSVWQCVCVTLSRLETLADLHLQGRQIFFIQVVGSGLVRQLASIVVFVPCQCP